MIVEYQNVCVTVMRTQKLYLDQIVLRNRRQGDTPGAYLWWTPGPYLWWSSGLPVVGRPGRTNGGTPGAYLWWDARGIPMVERTYGGRPGHTYGGRPVVDAPPPSDPLRDPQTHSKLIREYCKTSPNGPSWTAANGRRPGGSCEGRSGVNLGGGSINKGLGVRGVN